MSLFVVDASVGLQWFVPEIYQDGAQRLQNSAHQLHIPTLFDVEIANILWKKIQRGELTRAEADAAIAQLPFLPLTRHTEAAVLTQAFDLACQTQRTVYDSLCLALAINLGGQMVTADQKFRNALAATPLAVHLCWVEDVP